MRYLLGVDGGNTKTDYLLCTEDGDFVDVYRCGTCSHEATDESYDGMERTMREQLSVILSRNGVTVSDIAAGGFGLAGADLPSQIKELTNRVGRIGFKRFSVANDGLLGIKAASENGTGLCVVNGTGTVVIGVDSRGEILQVGGVGDISGDKAGGGYAFREILYYLYAHYFRCGDNSSLFPRVMSLLNLGPRDLLALVHEPYTVRRHTVEILQMADAEAQSGDAVSRRIFDEMGAEMGNSAAGCAKLLDFGAAGTDDNPISVILVGSIWHKIKYTGMKDVFIKTFREKALKACKLLPLDAPAAAGGVLWAKELLDSKPVGQAYRGKVLTALTLKMYEKKV